LEEINRKKSTPHFYRSNTTTIGPASSISVKDGSPVSFKKRMSTPNIFQSIECKSPKECSAKYNGHSKRCATAKSMRRIASSSSKNIKEYLSIHGTSNKLMVKFSPSKEPAKFKKLDSSRNKLIQTTE
jgi:hypothetical protein